MKREKEGSLEEADKRLNIQEDVGCLRDVSMWPVKRNLGWRENGLSTVLFPRWTLISWASAL